MTVRILRGDAREALKILPAESVHCVVTSPPYWGLRDYGAAGQLGLESTPQAYVENMVAVFREVWRVLRDDGTLWLNLGDSYATAPNGGHGNDTSTLTKPKDGSTRAAHHANPAGLGAGRSFFGLKQKDLVMIPARVALALQADGWYLRQDIIWAKPNPMPESVRDRCTKSHEYLFLLSKSPQYYFDADAISEDQVEHERTRWLRKAEREEPDRRYKLARDQPHGQVAPGANGCARSAKARQDLALKGSRNKRSVWTVTTQPFKEAHFATFPPALIEPCIKAGTSERGVCAHCLSPWARSPERAHTGVREVPRQGLPRPRRRESA